jgi:hypothetical protein
MAEQNVKEESRNALAGTQREEVGQCESCNRKLYEGDRGFSYRDGPITCEECSPTLADVIDQNREHLAIPDLDDDDREDAERSLRSMLDRLAAGESAASKVTWVL